MKSDTVIPEEKTISLIKEGPPPVNMTGALTHKYDIVNNFINNLVAFEQARIKVENARSRGGGSVENKMSARRNSDLDSLSSSDNSSSDTESLPEVKRVNMSSLD